MIYLNMLVFIVGMVFTGLAAWEWIKVRNHVQLNEWRRLASQGVNAVPDFIPPGAEAEVVKTEKEDKPAAGDWLDYDLIRRPCFGCRYAGRYVLRASVDYSEFVGQK